MLLASIVSCLMNGSGSLRRAVTLFLTGALTATVVVAQQPVPPRKRIISNTLVKTDTEVDAAIAEAKQALDQNRPADAVKLYQTLIEQSGDLLYAVDAEKDRGLYAPVALAVRAELQKLPDAVADLYRSTYEPVAQSKFIEATVAFDAPSLRAIAARWPLTESAAKSLERAGAIFFDRGEFSRAAECWQDLLRDRGSSLPRETVIRLQTQLVVALIESERVADAESWRKTLREKSPGAKSKFGGEEIEVGKFLDGYFSSRPPSSVLRPPSAEDWPMFGGDATGTRLMVDAEPVLDPQWVHDTGEKVDPIDFSSLRRAGNMVFWNGQWVQQSALQQFRDEHLSLLPVVIAPERGAGTTSERLARTRVIIRSQRRLGCLDLIGGRLLWQADAPYFGGSVSYDESGFAVVNTADALSATVADGLVFTIENAEIPNPGVFRRGGVVDDKFSMSSSLAARDMTSGKLVWKIGRGHGDNDFIKTARFISTPTVADGLLYVIVIQSQGFTLVCLDARDGRFRWKTFLSQLPMTAMAGWGQMQPNYEAAPPVIEGNRVFCSTDAGVIAAADADSGQILWARQYAGGVTDPQAALRGEVIAAATGYPHNRSMVRGGVLYVLPSDSNDVLVLDAGSGKILWRKFREGQRYLAGLVPVSPTGGTSASDLVSQLILCSPSAVALAASDGQQLWRAARHDLMGRPALTRDRLYSCAPREGILAFSVADGALSKLYPPVAPDAVVGNLLTIGGVVLASTDTKVASYFDYQTSYDIATRRITDYPDWGDGYFLRGMISLKSSRAREALDDFLKGWPRLPADTTADKRNEWAEKIFRAYVLQAAMERGKVKASPPNNWRASLELAAPFAVTPILRAELAVRWARAHEKRGSVADAVTALQSILTDGLDVTLVLPNFEAEENGTLSFQRGGGVSSSHYAQQEITRLLAANGRGIYAKIEQAARLAETEAATKADGIALMQVAARYPNSEAAELAWLDLSRLRLAQNDPQSAADALSELSSRRTTLHVADALMAMVICREKAGANELVESGLQRLASVLAENPSQGTARISFGGFDGSPRQFLAARAAALKLDVTALASTDRAADLPLPLGPPKFLANTRLMLDRIGGSPLHWRNSVFAVEEDKLVLLEMPSQRPIWKAEGNFGGAPRAPGSAVPAGAPQSPWAATVVGDMFVMADGAEVFAIDLAGGKRIWKEKCPDYFKQTPALVGYRAPRKNPSTKGGDLVVMIHQADTIVATDPQTGQKKWELKLTNGAGQVLQPTQLWMQGRHVIVGQLKRARFWTVEAETGKLVAEMDAQRDLFDAKISSSGALVTVNESDVGAYDLRTGKKLWNVTSLGTRPRLLAVDDQAAYVAGSVGRADDMAAISLQTGKLLWRTRLALEGKSFLPLQVRAESGVGQVFVVGTDVMMRGQINFWVMRGGLMVLDENNLPQPLKLLALSASNGQLIWSHLPSPIRMSRQESTRLMQGGVQMINLNFLQPQGNALPPAPLPYWLTETQVFLLDAADASQRQLTVRDRFNGKVLQQLDVGVANRETPAMTDQQRAAAGAIALVPILGRRVGVMESGALVGAGTSPQAALVGGVMLLQESGDCVVLQKEGAAAKNEGRKR